MSEVATPETKKLGAAMAKHVSAEAQRKACGNFARFDYGMSRGHRDYIYRAQRNDRFYLGGGLQWELEDVRERERTNRRSPEQNEIKQMVNTAIGYQIANRMDIAVRPRGRGADDASAEVFGKVIKQVADNTKLHWRETEVFADGMIKQRGYYDIRMSFETNAFGEIAVETLDPEDVLPDPDARDYDTDKWNDVTVRRWMTLDHIEQTFGKAARRAVETYGSGDASLEGDSTDQLRSRFGNYEMGEWALYGDSDAAASTLYLVIDRQYRTYESVRCAVYPNGDIRQIPTATPQQVAAYVQQGAIITKRMQRRVKWLVSTRNVALFDDYSPYPWFTVVGFFPYFRRGQTRGMVDDAVSIQESVNKGIADIGQALTTVANSGYAIEQGSLVDQSIDEFKAQAAKNGLVIHYKQGSKRPERLDPPAMPAGMFEYVKMQAAALRSTTMDESLTAAGPVGDQSGVAYQARQYAAQQKLAVPLDNLARTRHAVAMRFVDLIQMFMDAPQVLRIIEVDPYGKEQSVELPVNQPQEGVEPGLVEWLNDLTLGEYDLVISEQPMQITFDNSQFEQLKALVDMGYTIPIGYAIRYSNLTDKSELAKAIEEASAVKPDPEVEAKIKLLLAQAEKTITEAVNKRIEAVYGATQAGAQIATIPQTASLADEILQSAGFVDQNAAPIIPQDQVGAGLAAAAPLAPTVAPTDQGIDPLDPSTNPLTPENPGVGLNNGIEAEGVQ